MKCHACQMGNLHQRSKSQTYTYKGKSITLKQPGLWCDYCDEGILSGDDLEKTEKTFDAFKAEVDGILTPTEIRRIRKNVLGLSQKEAAEIFGGGHNAFGRYERGEARPMMAIINLLKMFERHPEDIKYFRY
ncbi:MAG: type II toxin-antitoxin system MqsA family antitoxin [Legionellales bacterium]|nr:type II toxin-antitoxin system MqsA family antitoxin [Legionellales bacterium]